MTDEAVNSPIRRSGCHELPTKSGSLLPAAPINAPWRTVSPHLAAWRSPGCKPERLSATAPCVPLRYALPGPIPRGLDSKGGGRGPRPLCRFKGVRGEIEIPPRFSLGGSGGTFSFQKRISPLASAGNPGPLREQGICGVHSPRQSRVSCPGSRDCPLHYYGAIKITSL